MLSSTRDAFGAGLVWAMGLLAFTHAATWALNGAGWVLAGHGWSSTVVDGWLSELTLLAPTVVCWLALSRVGLGGPQVLLPAAAMTLYIAGSTSSGFVGGAGSVPLPFVAEHGVLSFYPLISATLAVAVRPPGRRLAPSVWLDRAVGSLDADWGRAVLSCSPIRDRLTSSSRWAGGRSVGQVRWRTSCCALTGGGAL